MNAFFVSLEIYSFYVLVEESFISVGFFFEEMAGFFFEEMAVFLGLAAF